MEHARGTSLPPFNSGHRRAQWVMVLFSLIILISVIAAVADYSQIRLASRAIAGETITLAEANANDSRQSTIGSLGLLAYIAASIAFLMWIHRARKNLQALGVRGLRFSSGWAVGWFFVPIFSLFRPFQVVNEIWKGSDSNALDDLSWKGMPSSALVGWWWALFLITNLIGRFVLSLFSTGGDTLSGLLTTSRAALFSDLVEVPAALLAILLVRRIDARQEEKHRAERYTREQELVSR